MSAINHEGNQRASRMSGRPPRSSAGRTNPDVVIEHIDPRLFGSAELDVLEHSFGDIVARVLGR